MKCNFYEQDDENNFLNEARDCHAYKQDIIDNIKGGGPISDNVINEMLLCLKSSFQDINGFQNVELGKDINFSRIRGMPWIQVYINL